MSKEVITDGSGSPVQADLQVSAPCDVEYGRLFPIRDVIGQALVGVKGGRVSILKNILAKICN